MLIANRPETSTFQLGKVTIPYVEHGKPDGRLPLVLFNGISMDENHWGKFPEALNRHVFAMGFPIGGNPFYVPSIRYYARQMERALPSVIQGNEFDGLGLSWGGLLVQGVRKGMRKRVIAASLPAAASLCIKPNIPDSKALRVVASTKRQPEDVADLYGGDIRANPELLKDLPIDRHINALRHMRQQFAAMTSGYLMLQNMITTNMPPTMVMAGTDDPLMRYPCVRGAAEWIGADLATIENGGHGFLLTRPEESAKIVNEFLDS